MTQIPGSPNEPHPNPPSCEVCRILLEAADVVRAFNKTGNYDESTLTDGSTWKSWTMPMEQVLDGCSHHQPFFSHYLSEPNITQASVDFSFGRLHLHQTDSREGDDRQWTSSAGELLLLDGASSEPGMALGRVLDPQYIDLALINGWKTHCVSHHGGKCSDKITTLDHPILYLIDTEQMCLVAGEDADYVALSYVWGQVPTLKTTQANVQDLQQPGALEKLKDQIPATIQDSIKLVPLLGERYLWVDSLCIVQDDETSAHRQIDQMAAIFEKATLTIVVAEGRDASSGLRGLQHVPRPRQANPVLNLTPETSFTVRQEGLLSWSPWSSRGWTMQEHIFSCRKIIFFKDTVRWTCRSSSYYEDLNSPLDLRMEALAADGGEKLHNYNPLDLSLGVPDLSILCSLISNYNKRALSFAEDAIPAFSSTFGAMRRAFPRGFLFGLPVSFLDACLVWRSRPNFLTRRCASREGVDVAPGWSWAGWRGRVESYAWTAGCYMKNQPFNWGRAHWEPFQVIPMLTWYTRDSKDGEERIIPFQNEWYDFKARFMGEADNLPPGWTYKLEDPAEEEKRITETLALETFNDDPECQVTYCDLQTPYYYEHESCPGRKFWHPVPMGTTDEQMVTSHGRFLCARAQKAHLWAAKPHWDDKIKRAVSFEGPDDFVLDMFGYNLGVTCVLKDEDGEDVGELGPDSKEDKERIWEGGPLGTQIEVVAISKGLHFPDPQVVKKETWSFYNVLWVEWEDGIARRRGIGRVRRSVWERLEKEDVSLVLG
ncbi:hypothetical protein ACJ41O_000208 [Fusarium nematophilum]